MRLQNYTRPPDLSAGRVFFAMNSRCDDVDRLTVVSVDLNNETITGRSAHTEVVLPLSEIALKPSRVAALPGDEAPDALVYSNDGDDIELALVLVLMGEWWTGQLRDPYQFAPILKTGFCRAERWVVWKGLSDQQKEWWLPILNHQTPPETPVDSKTGWPAPLFEQWVTALTEAAAGLETGPGWGCWDPDALVECLKSKVSADLRKQIFLNLPPGAQQYYRDRRNSAPTAA